MMYRSKKSELSASELLDLLNEQDECDWLEAKSLAHDTSRSVLESVNSFANEPGLGGGVILLGIAENEEEDGPRYVVEGIADTDKAQLDLATQCKSAFNSAVYPTIQVERIGDKSVLKVIVDELPQAHKPLYGCLAKAVAPDLAGLKRQGLMVQKGQRRGTYYVPSELLKENIPFRAESIPAGGESIPPAMPDNGENPQARGENPQARGENPQARGENPQAQMPESIRNRIAELKRHERRSVISCLIYDMCNVRPLTKSELAKMLNRTEDYVAELVKPMLGERLEYLYPMMVHHPHQAYVAKSSNNL